MEMIYDDFNFVIKEIEMVHEYTFCAGNRFDFLSKRKVFGLVYVLDGELEYTFLSGETIKVKKGDTYLLTPDCAYKARCINDCRHYTVNFSLDLMQCEGVFAKDIFSKESATVSEAPPSCVPLFSKLCDIWQTKTEGYRTFAVSVLYELIYHFIKSAKPQKNVEEYARIYSAKAYIEENWNKDFSIPQLAFMCCLSVSYFRHMFFTVFKQSPIQYRNSLRILHAKDMLMQKYLTICEISYICGFEDPNYFSRFFKKETGISPKRFRED